MPPEPLPRAITQTVASALAVHPVVALTGARQTGKSTLVRRGGVGAGRRYVTLDDVTALAAARRTPHEFVVQAPELVIDEVQRAPDLLLEIKMAVDETYPRHFGQFILTGSANLLLMKHVSESLAGRATYVTLWPMTRRELLGFGSAGVWSTLLETPHREWYDLLRASSAPAGDWRELAERGGYPQAAYELESARARQSWFDGYVKTYLERDVPTLSPIEHMPDFRRVMELVTLRLGGLQNQTDIARDAGLPQATVHRYLNLLETSYQLVRLAPYSVNRTKRLTKSPKLYWSDTGLALFLSRVTEPTGAHLENLVLQDLLVWRETQIPRPEVLYWRTDTGHEVDFVIEAASNHVVPIEVKATTRPSTRDLAGLRVFMEEYADRVTGGLLLYNGTETYWAAKDVLATPWWTVL